MTGKKTTPQRKRKPARSKKKRPLKKELVRAFAGLGALILVVLAAGIAAQRLLPAKPDAPAASRQKSVRFPVKVKRVNVFKKPADIQPVRTKPKFEVFPEKEIPHYKPMIVPPVPLPEKRPRVALIIDDLGYDRRIAEKFIGLDAVLTFSVLPHSPFQHKIVQTARRKGFEVMLHLPMEPEEYPRIDPGPGALLVSMSPDELIRQLQANIDSVPFIRGVNNHMGSRMTADSDRMNQIFSVLKQRGLFFIDSRTTPKSFSFQSAKLFKVPFAQRDVFLDHIQDAEKIRQQIDKLIHYAGIHGEAVGIGHPHTITLETLRDRLPELKQKVKLVPASQIVHQAG